MVVVAAKLLNRMIIGRSGCAVMLEVDFVHASEAISVFARGQTVMFGNSEIIEVEGGRAERVDVDVLAFFVKALIVVHGITAASRDCGGRTY
jgi:hypothetical protein